MAPSFYLNSCQARSPLVSELSKLYDKCTNGRDLVGNLFLLFIWFGATFPEPRPFSFFLFSAISYLLFTLPSYSFFFFCCHFFLCLTHFSQLEFSYQSSHLCRKSNNHGLLPYCFLLNKVILLDHGNGNEPLMFCICTWLWKHFSCLSSMYFMNTWSKQTWKSKTIESYSVLFLVTWSEIWTSKNWWNFSKSDLQETI